MTTTFAWDAQQYRRFDDDRSRPFFDLLGRIGATGPRTVVDAGCGPGHLTGVLAERWPHAAVIGFDSSPQMIAAAPSAGNIRFEQDDVVTWDPAGADVIVSNAVLQWLPKAQAADVLTRWAAALPAGGWLGVQVPLNFDAPSHALMRAVAADYPSTEQAFRAPHAVFDLHSVTDLLLTAGLVADVWESTYVHILTGPDPVLAWVRGTGLRPVLAALADEPEQQAAFERTYAARLREAYPRREDGTTLLPFRRLLAVGHRA